MHSRQRRFPARPLRLQRGAYADRLAEAPPGWFDVLRFAWTAEERARRAAVDELPVRRAEPAPVGERDTALTWVGHATYLIRMQGVAVLADPVWSARVPGVPQRLTPPGVEFDDLPPIAAVLISHNHYDHLDEPTVQRFPRNTPMLVPAGLARWFERRGFTYAVELDWWESVRISGLRFTFVPARHWSRRLPWDTGASLWGGWVITSSRSRVLHTGDTGYGRHFAEIGQWYSGIDAVMVPIGGYEPRQQLQQMHMTPEEAVHAVRDLGASYGASMHWGTFPLSREPAAEPLQRFRAYWTRLGLDEQRRWDLAVGETRVVPHLKRGP
ncbi:MBL fold metallo-hydrolase [Salinifilum aidingensis]